MAARFDRGHPDALADGARFDLTVDRRDHRRRIDLAIAWVEQALAVPTRLKAVFLQELLRLDEQRALLIACRKHGDSKSPVPDLLAARRLDHPVVVLARDLPDFAGLFASIAPAGLRVARCTPGEQEACVAPARAPGQVVSLDQHRLDPATRQMPEQAHPGDPASDHKDVGLLRQTAGVLLRRGCPERSCHQAVNSRVQIESISKWRAMTSWWSAEVSPASGQR